MTRCATCRRSVLRSWETWDGLRLCGACIARFLREADRDAEVMEERLRRFVGPPQVQWNP